MQKVTENYIMKGVTRDFRFILFFLVIRFFLSSVRMRQMVVCVTLLLLKLFSSSPNFP